MFKRLLPAVLICLATAGGARAETYDFPPPYAPQEKVSGTIRIWGHGAYAGRFDFIEALVKAWENGFKKYQPDITIERHLYGTASAIGSLFTGTGDLALMGREIWPNEVAAFKEVKGYAPNGVDILTGSFNVRNRGYAIVLFVHKDNPLAKLTLNQVDAIFSADHRSAPKAARTWGDLGLTGEWADKPIHPYGFPIARGFGEFLEDYAFQGARKWNPDLREFPDQPASTGGATDGGQMMLDALAKDKYAIAISGLVYNHPDVKPLALAAKEGEPYYEPTKQNVIDRKYPLPRIITMFFDRPPGQPVDPKVREFLRYILSREAQEAVLKEGGGYLPVTAPYAARELEKLN